MIYFGGGVLDPEVNGPIHPSLRAFIDCFCSMPMPKIYPRGGGPHDQDPTLMRDFRNILRFKGQSEELEDAKRKAQEQLDKQGFESANPSASTGGGLGLEGLLDQLQEDSEM